MIGFGLDRERKSLGLPALVIDIATRFNILIRAFTYSRPPIEKKALYLSKMKSVILEGDLDTIPTIESHPELL